MDGIMRRTLFLPKNILPVSKINGITTFSDFH